MQFVIVRAKIVRLRSYEAIYKQLFINSFGPSEKVDRDSISPIQLRMSLVYEYHSSNFGCFKCFIFISVAFSHGIFVEWILENILPLRKSTNFGDRYKTIQTFCDVDITLSECAIRCVPHSLTSSDDTAGLVSTRMFPLLIHRLGSSHSMSALAFVLCL